VFSILFFQQDFHSLECNGTGHEVQDFASFLVLFWAGVEA